MMIRLEDIQTRSRKQRKKVKRYWKMVQRLHTLDCDLIKRKFGDVLETLGLLVRPAHPFGDGPLPPTMIPEGRPDTKAATGSVGSQIDPETLIPELEFCVFHTRSDFDKQQAGSSVTLRLRQRMEASLAPAYALHRAFKVSAFCVGCAKRFELLSDYQFAFSQSPDGVNWRERLVCPDCGLNCRLRASFFLLRAIGGDRRKEIYITEQVTPFFRILRGHYPKLVGSEFLRDGTPPGYTSAAGTRCEDVTSLTFSSEKFDIVASFEVLEHVPDYKRALHEFRRVLRPGGVLMLSVPFRTDLENTLVRARLTEGGGIEHILPPEIHGDPLDQAGALCFYHFGWDLLDQLRLAGFEKAEVVKLWSRRYGYLGQGNIFIIAYV